MEKIINEVENALSILKSGGIILYPTDTIWGIGCDATNDDAILRINRLKGRDASEPMLSIINNSKMLDKYLHVKPVFINNVFCKQKIAIA